jgi:guanylate kinase
LGGVIDKADMQKRMRTAVEELQHALETDYFHFVINDDLEKTVQTVHRIAQSQQPVMADEVSRRLAEQIAMEISGRL